MAKWGAGTSGNPSGARTGRSRSIEGIRKVIQKFVSINIKDIQASYDKLSPEKKLLFLEKLLKLIIPSPEFDLSKLSEYDLDILIARLKEKEAPKMEMSKPAKVA